MWPLSLMNSRTETLFRLNSIAYRLGGTFQHVWYYSYASHSIRALPQAISFTSANHGLRSVHCFRFRVKSDFVVCILTPAIHATDICVWDILPAILDVLFDDAAQVLLHHFTITIIVAVFPKVVVAISFFNDR